ncbi:MAG TPA: Hpt domain-containing protein [Longimicrobiales bacterium]|nr:Hpt domain-containing protein [Longimicrobiales bacterium]
MPESSVLDDDAVARLREWGGNKLLGQMIRLFLENAPGRMDQIRTGSGGGDIKEAERGAHSLKSSAANIGAMEVRKFAAEIERAAGEGDLKRVQELVPSIETAFADAVAALGTMERGLTG